jgi:hypothetical protein
MNCFGKEDAWSVSIQFTTSFFVVVVVVVVVVVTVVNFRNLYDNTFLSNLPSCLCPIKNGVQREYSVSA